MFTHEGDVHLHVSQSVLGVLELLLQAEGSQEVALG